MASKAGFGWRSQDRQTIIQAPPFTDNPESHLRILLIAAHPDDETIGAGVLLSQAEGPAVVHVTDGSPINMADARAAGFSTREAYMAARRDEVLRALSHAGIAPHAVTRLHFIDQQVSFRMKELALAIAGLLDELQPDVLLTHAYEGGHPDHDAVAFACHAARWIYSAAESQRDLRIIEFAGYNWQDGLCASEFLPSSGSKEYEFRLDPEQRSLKMHMLGEFRTQVKPLEPFMLANCERFRIAPEYDFLHPPLAGRLFYENFDWGVDGAEWRELARQALCELPSPRAAS
jgi:LmbE family N-acetylglucosaminyl deacetylase